MTPARLLPREARVILGLNSGTSADGVDLAAIRVSGAGSKAKISFLCGRTKRYPPGLCSEISRAIEARSIKPEQLVAIDNILGRYFANTARRLINELKSRRISVHAVGSHGQTIRHLPSLFRTEAGYARGSLQIGSPDHIATVTGLPVVSDFRQADIALGGEGAPITVAAMHRLFSHAKEPRLIVNIGGIANYFYFPAGRKTEWAEAADCGPGNSLIDSLTRILFDLPFDRSGRLAARGNVSRTLLGRLQRTPFFSRRPKGAGLSTGKEEFGSVLARRIIRSGYRSGIEPHNLLATVTELTVWGIVRSIRPLVSKLPLHAKLYLTGGGARNSLIRRRLKQELPEMSVCSIDELGIPSSLVEAAAFAVMADATLRSTPLPTRFGKNRRQRIVPISGRISLPPVETTRAKK